MKIAAYCRVSTEKDEQLDSLENQKEFFEEYAKKMDMNWSDYMLMRVFLEQV